MEKKEKKRLKKEEAELEGKNVLASKYLHAAFMEAPWLSAEYKELAEKYISEPKIIRELYLCACDGVKINILQIAETKKPIDESFRRCRKRHLEERFLKEYSQELESIKAISSSVANEVKSVSEKVNHIAEHIPSMEEMFPQTEPPKDVPTEQIKSNLQPSSKIEVTVKNESRQRVELLKHIGHMFQGKKNMTKYMESLVKEGYSMEQINFILDCIEQGDTIKDVERYASSKLDIDIMKKLRAMQKGGSKNG